MSYTSTIWTNGITGKAMNHQEGQYSAAKEDIDLHGHPVAHYLKTESDAKFFPIASGMDAQYIDGYDIDDLLGFQVDPGIIILHTADDADFTNGYLNADPRWHQCDGSTINSIKCPDMRGYFPKCPSSSSITGTGGASSTTLTGSVAVGDHTLTLAEIPSHYHDWTDRYYGGSAITWATYESDAVNPSPTNRTGTTDYNHAAADEAHNHGSKSVNFNSISLTPLWKAYWFLIKIA